MRYLWLFGLPLVLSLILTPLLIRLDRRVGLLDLPDDRRKLHLQPVPTAGGAAVMAAYFIALLVNQALFGSHWGVGFKLTLGLILGPALVGALGLLDDRRRVGPWAKIGVQVAGGLVIYTLGFRVNAITHPFGDYIPLGLLALPATLIWVLVITNAVNLIDGVDGLAAAIVTISLATLIAVSLRAGEVRVLFYAGALAGAVAGFYVYNFPPAKIFLGDCGSLALGFSLAAISLIENRKGTTTLSLLVPIVAMGVPLLDTGLAFIRRSANGLNPLRPDRQHLHHRLLRLGLTPRQVVLLFVYASLYLGFSATLLALLPKAYVLLMVVVLGLGVLVAMGFLRFLEGRLGGEEEKGATS